MVSDRVAVGEMRPAQPRAMATVYESAADWNRQNPPGTRVRIVLRDGSAVEAHTRSYAQQWGALAVITLEGQSGLFTAAALQPVGHGLQLPG
jgi:hypothetical protein